MPRINLRFVSRLGPGVVLAGLLGACAPSPRVEGVLPAAWSQITPKTFMVARAPGLESDSMARAREAVVKRLAGFGFEENANGRFRVEISFAVRPTNVVLGDPQTSRAVAPPALCRRVSYALSVVVTDRATGTPLLRRLVQAARCPGKEERSIDELAKLVFERTAVGR